MTDDRVDVKGDGYCKESEGRRVVRYNTYACVDYLIFVTEKICVAQLVDVNIRARIH